MSFYANYPVKGGGVLSVNTLTGALTLTGGTGITVTSSGTNINITTSALLAAVTSINSDTSAAQTLVVGNTGTDFAIVDGGAGLHTFNLPDASNTARGVINTSAQAIAGTKTFSSLLNADGGIDRSTPGTLTIGATNATTINIGNSGATVNIQGTTVYENTPVISSVAPLITVNAGGAAGSGQNSGIQVNEASVITGYAETSSDRNSWIFKAPNTTGIATITPGISGITLNQSSHDPVTLGTANGLSLSTQVLSLAAASNTTTGALTSTDWSTFNNKQDAGNYVTSIYIASTNGFAGTSTGGISPTLTLSTTITGILLGNGTSVSAAAAGSDYSAGTASLATGILKSTTTTGALSIAVASDFPVLNQNTTGTASNITTTSNSTLTTLSSLSLPTSQLSGSVSLTSQVSGILPVANGGTGDSTFTPYTIVSAGATSTAPLVNLGSGTSTQVLTSNGAGAYPTWQNAAATGVTSVGLVDSTGIFNVTGSPVIATGTLTLSSLKSQSANEFFAAPNGSAGSPSFRSIVSADIPTLNQNTTGTAANVTGVVAVANGGTGQSSTLSANGIIYAPTTTTMGSIAPSTAGYVLTSNGASSVPTWAPSGGGGSKNYLAPVVTSLGGGSANIGNGNFELGTTTGWSLFNTTVSYQNTQTVTITVASPAVFTSSSAHGLVIGQALSLQSTGLLPTGLSTNTTYYVVSIPSATTFTVALSPSGTAVNTTVGGSGVQTYGASALPAGSVSTGASSVTTFNTVSSGQLSGNYSLQTASSGVWSQGQGFLSDAFYIDLEDQAKVMTIKAYYKAVSGVSNVSFSSNSSNTFALYIYDVTNSIWIQPAGVYGFSQSAGVGYLTGTFQTSSNGTQYRLAIIAVNASSGTLTMYWDDISCGPQTAPLGAVITDSVSYTPTFGAGWGIPTSVNMFWQRVGDRIHIFGSLVAGTTTSGSSSISLPGGLSTKTFSGTTYLEAGNLLYGSGVSGNFVYLKAGYSSSSNSILIITPANAANTAFNAQNVTAVVASNYLVTVEAWVPVAGWSSNVQMSNDTDTRVITAKYEIPNGTVISATQPVNASTLIFDTAGAVTPSSTAWKFVAPVSGYYKVAAGFYNGGSGGANVYVYKNGVKSSYMFTQSANYGANGSAMVQCNAGDYLDVRTDTSFTTNNSVISNQFVSVERISGPATIAANETVSASYYVSANFSASTSIPIDFDTKEWDSHGAVTVSSTAWRFTAPISGTYSISGCIGGATSTSILLYKNGTALKTIGFQGSTVTGAVSGSMKLIAGDYVDVRPAVGETVSGGALSSNGTSTIAITRLGN